MALTENTLDVPLLPPNQQGISTKIPAGTIRSIVNGVSKRYDEGPGGNATALRIEKRNAFQQVTKEIRSPVDGSSITVNGFQNPPNLFDTLGDQAVVAADTAPHVLAEGANSWSKFPYVYSPKKLKIKTVYGGNAIDAASRL